MYFRSYSPVVMDNWFVDLLVADCWRRILCMYCNYMDVRLCVCDV